MKIIDTHALKENLDADRAVFDVRGDVKFEQGHIPGAYTAPLGSLVFRIVRVMNPDSFVAVYSEGENCDLAAQAAERLTNLGMKNVHLYQAGLEGWREAGHAIVTSVRAKLHTHGPVQDCRPLVVDRARAYGGAFAGAPVDGEGAGG